MVKENGRSETVGGAGGVKEMIMVIMVIMMTRLCKGRGQLGKVQRNLVTRVRVAPRN